MASQYNKIILLMAVLVAVALAVRLCPTTNAAKGSLIQMFITRQTTTKKTVTAVLWNNLKGHGNLDVHCTEAGADAGLGVRKVAYGENTKLEFSPDGYADCSLGFDGKMHLYKNRFDVYQNGRDEGCGSGLDRSCNWVIKENGPCFHDDDLSEDLCFPWDKNVYSYSFIH